MKKILLVLMSIICLFSLTACDEKESELKNEIKTTMNTYIDSLLDNTPSYIPYWNKESFKGRWNYIDGVFLNSIVNLYKETSNEKYKEFFLNYIDYYINDFGQFINPQTLEVNFQIGELDSICASKILFDAYEMTGKAKYLLAIEETYKYLSYIPKAENTKNFSHKEIYLNQIWLDGMYMYVPFYLRYANLKEMNNVYAEVKEQYKYIRDNMFSEEKQLYYHGHDTTKSIFWADRSTGNSKSFWLRSIGWYIVSLTDSIEYINDKEIKAYLISLLNEALLGVLQYQDEKSKMFYQLVDKKEYSVFVGKGYFKGLNNTKYIVNGEYEGATVDNYLESSGSSMISYALLKSARLGYIDKSLYSKGVEVFESIYNTCVSKEDGIHLNNICITAGLGPKSKIYRDGTAAYYLAEPVGSDDAKGVGPFIMAYLEYIR